MINLIKMELHKKHKTKWINKNINIELFYKKAQLSGFYVDKFSKLNSKFVKFKKTYFMYISTFYTLRDTLKTN